MAELQLPRGLPSSQKTPTNPADYKNSLHEQHCRQKKNVLAVQGLRRSCSRKEQEWSKEQKSAEILSTEH